MELTSKQKGNLTELQCLAAFMAQGCAVSIPYGDNNKYDFIADVNGKLIKVQVKIASLEKNTEDAISFSCRSVHVNCKETKIIRYNSNEVDYFATYWKNECYLVPITECSVKKILRFAPPKNEQIVGINFAKDYNLGLQLTKIREGENN